MEKLHGTGNKEVFKIYEHVTKELLNEVMSSLMLTIGSDLDKYCEKVIFDEF